MSEMYDDGLIGAHRMRRLDDRIAADILRMELLHSDELIEARALEAESIADQCGRILRSCPSSISKLVQLQGSLIERAADLRKQKRGRG